MNFLINYIKGKLDDRRRWSSDLDLTDSQRIEKWGHRNYTGGTSSENWYGHGKRQFYFLLSNGLLPSMNFLDVACGALRLGQYVIPYLNRGNYYGIDISQDLIDLGIKHELTHEIYNLFNPVFDVNDEFYSQISGFDMAMSNSLFTHLNETDIKTCFHNLHKLAKPDSSFFFTFFEGCSSKNIHQDSHANKRWEYSFAQMQSLAAPYFNLKYIGDWGHPGNQMMIRANPL